MPCWNTSLLCDSEPLRSSHPANPPAQSPSVAARRSKRTNGAGAAWARGRKGDVRMGSARRLRWTTSERVTSGRVSLWAYRQWFSCSPMYTSERDEHARGSYCRSGGRPHRCGDSSPLGPCIPASEQSLPSWTTCTSEGEPRSSTAAPRAGAAVGNARAVSHRHCRSFMNAVVKVLALAWDDFHKSTRSTGPSCRSACASGSRGRSQLA
jgi:hypothetical protein